MQVLLLEAGGGDATELIANPNLWPLTLGSELDWGFVAEPITHLNGRAIPYSMGKVLGGGSSINVSVWSRGHRADWDFYASEAGDPAWGYEAVLDLYRSRIESWTGGADRDYRGIDGTVHVQPASNPHPFSFALLESAQSVGLQRFPNANGSMMEATGGCAFVDETVCRGKRQSTFRSYVYPLMDRPNITVLTDALVRQVLFNHRRATGIEFDYQGKTLRADATGEVVLSLGAIHTPKVLMHSGIGDEAELKRVDIPVLQALPGVGRNLHDHLAFGCIWENTDEALPNVPRSQTVCFWKTKAELDAPNFYAYARQGPDVTPENAVQFQTSRRLMVTRGRYAAEKPRCYPLDWFGSRRSREDRRELSLGCRGPERSSSRFENCSRDWQLGSFATFYRARDSTWFSDATDLEHFFRNGVSTFWHQSGSAKMGRDAMSVVDGTLKVYGVDGLRIADASILPRVTTGNTMAPCVVIGEQAAALLQRTTPIFRSNRKMSQPVSA